VLAGVTGLVLLLSRLSSHNAAAPASIGRIVALAGLDDEVGATATFLLRPADCQGDLRELVGIANGLLAKHVKVAGLVLTPDDADNWREAIETYDIAMPLRAVYEEDANESLAQLGIRTTPALVLQDPLRRSYSVVVIRPGMTGLSATSIPVGRSDGPESCVGGDGCQD